MKKSLVASVTAFCALLGAPLAANAIVYQFNATLNASSEVPTTSSTATGIASLSYDTHNTLSLSDDTYSFTESVFGLSGPATGYHIHGAATATETAPVIINFANPPFVTLVSGGTLLVGASNVPANALFPATPASSTNAGHPAMSFLDMLQSGLAYVNVHTATFPGGEIRGQLMQVAAVVPEPGTSALLLAGLATVGLLARRRIGKR